MVKKIQSAKEIIDEIINQAKLTETLLCGGGIPETKELKNGFYSCSISSGRSSVSNAD